MLTLKLCKTTEKIWLLKSTYLWHMKPHSKLLKSKPTHFVRNSIWNFNCFVYYTSPAVTVTVTAKNVARPVCATTKRSGPSSIGTRWSLLQNKIMSHKRRGVLPFYLLHKTHKQKNIDRLCINHRRLSTNIDIFVCFCKFLYFYAMTIFVCLFKFMFMNVLKYINK